jgi:hypothetical protein
MSCLDQWNSDMKYLNHFCAILNKKNEYEDPYKWAMLDLDQRTARSTIPIPLYRVLLNGVDNFAVLKYHVRASIDRLEKIHDHLFHIQYEGIEKDCMTRSAEKILQLHAKLGWEDLQVETYLSAYKHLL